jgi:acetyl-CoA acyltransferase
MNPVYLVDYLRSPFTRAHPVKEGVDAFQTMRADDIFVQLIDNLLNERGYAQLDIEELAIGCALPVKEQWSFGGRYPILMSSLSDTCSSRMIEQQCGSGIAAIRSAAMSIASGSANLVLAGGYENMTRVPMGPSLFQQGILTVPSVPGGFYDMDVAMNMGLTAEKLNELSGIPRTVMDQFAVESHANAVHAEQNNFLAGECIPIQLADGTVVSKDACIRQDTNLESLSHLRTIFKEDGVITAGNSSPLSTGAGLISLMSQSMLDNSGHKALAKIISAADVGVSPELMGSSIVPTVEKLLKINGLSVNDIDLWELNEAFSVVPLYAMQKLNIPRHKVNVNGGALALGHPLGATGIRLIGTLARALHSSDGHYGVASACIGGGQGIAMLIEKV